MKIGNLVRPTCQPIDVGKNAIDLKALGVVFKIEAGAIVKVKWPDGRILTFHESELEDLG